MKLYHGWIHSSVIQMDNTLKQLQKLFEVGVIKVHWPQIFGYLQMWLSH